MSLEKAIKTYKEYFSEKIETHGATPQGVDYNGSDAQEKRFAQLVKVINPSMSFSLIDYGCGYGAMFEYLNKQGWDFEYYGFDMLEKMVAAGQASHKKYANAHFSKDVSALPVADYLLAGSIFNNKFDAQLAEWQDLVLETLRGINALCSKGFSFNILTGYSDTDRMAQRPDLYFADPLFMFDFCKQNFSRNVALLHDYDLYDFTILVRKDG